MTARQADDLVERLVKEGRLMLNVAIEKCPQGWVYCSNCQSAFDVQASLLLDSNDDACPNCRVNYGLIFNY